MNKRDLINTVAEKSGVTKKQAREIIEIIFGSIAKEVADGGRVTLVNFGTFMSRKRAGRRGVHPGTTQPLYIPPKTVPVFRAGMAFREAVADNSKQV